MTVAQKILARAGGRTSAAVGETVVAAVDAVMFHDGTGPLILEAMRKAGRTTIVIPQKTFVIFDHGVPASTVRMANRQKLVRDFLSEINDDSIFFADAGEGICHQVLFETGRVRPGQLLVGADSHTCMLGAVGAFATGMGSTDIAAVLLTGRTWLEVPESIRVAFKGRLEAGVSAKDLTLHLTWRLGNGGANDRVLEYSGQGVAGLSLDDRLTLSNMAVETGATTGIMPYDDVARGSYGPGESLEADPGARYCRSLEIDLASLEPQVAHPDGFQRVGPVGEVEGTPIHQAFLGTCTNGRLGDLREAAKVLKGRKVARGCRMVVVPASRAVLQEALREGIIQTFVDAGAMIEHPNCGPCLGFHEGVLADGENCIAASSRNYKGRMGNPNAKIFLGSPATVAAAAVTGRITDPREFS